MNQWLELLLNGNYGATSVDVETGLFVLLLAFVIGQVIGWVYMGTHSVLSYSQTFVSSLVVIPVIVSLMMMLMSGSIVIAFGLLAVFAVVRFRNVLKDTRDTTFILWTIVEGMAVGTMQYSSALVGMVAIGLVLLYLRITTFGTRHRFDAVLTLQISGDPSRGMTALRQILKRHSLRTRLASERKLSDEGINISYRLLLRNSKRSGELQSELKAIEGFDQVSLFLREDELEI